MSVSPYIERLVAREKRERAAFRDTTLEKVIEWHQKRVGELTSGIAGVRSENKTMLKYRNALQMHDITLTYLKKLKERDA